MKGGLKAKFEKSETNTMTKTNVLEQKIRQSYMSKVVADKMIDDLNKNRITQDDVNKKLQNLERFRMLETSKEKTPLSEFEIKLKILLQYPNN